MTTTIALWPVAVEAFRALGRHYGPAMDQAAAALGLTGWSGWLLTALTFAPEPVSARRLRMRSPYTSARWYNEQFSRAVEQGLLTPGAEEEYFLTPWGEQAARRIVQAAYAKMAMLQPIPPTELEHLAGLLHRLLVSCLAAPEPPGKWCLRYSRRLDPGDDAHVVVRVDQYLTDLSAYRDDAHLAAWQPYHMEGHAWEAFTCLWRREATTLDGLYQKLERRGYSRDEYGQALEDLLQRGWIEVKEGEYHLTALGNAVRQAAEDATDRYFYAPWSCLSREETEALRTGLLHFRDGLQGESQVAP